MSYDARETSQYSGEPYELFRFHTETSSWLLTSAGESKTYNGEVYTPEAISHDEPTQGQEIKSGSLKVTVPRDHSIAQQFYAYIPSTPLWLTIYRAHEGDGETIVHWTGKVTSASFTETCELACVPEHEALKKHIPIASFGAQCNRIIFSPECGVQRLAHRVEAELTSVSDSLIKADEFASKPDGYFTNGYIEFGVQRRMVINHVGENLFLIVGMAGLASGDRVFAYAGCNRDYNGDCVSKFDNAVRFFGFKWLPVKNPFGDGVL